MGAVKITRVPPVTILADAFRLATAATQKQKLRWVSLCNALTKYKEGFLLQD